MYVLFPFLYFFIIHTSLNASESPSSKKIEQDRSLVASSATTCEIQKKTSAKPQLTQLFNKSKINLLQHQNFEKILLKFLKLQNFPKSRFIDNSKSSHYSQYYEDFILAYVLRNVKNGFYIDVGAGSPNTDPATKYFYERGWHGINIEPQNDFFSELQQYRTRDINICAVISDKSESADYYLPPENLSGLAGLSPKI